MNMMTTSIGGGLRVLYFGHSGWHTILIVEGVGVLVGKMVVVKVVNPICADKVAAGATMVVVNVGICMEGGCI